MTNITLRSPEQSSRFTGTIASLFTTAALILSGFLSLAIFAG